MSQRRLETMWHESEPIKIHVANHLLQTFGILDTFFLNTELQDTSFLPLNRFKS